MNLKAHWEKVFNSKKLSEMSWQQECPQKSLDLIGRTNLGSDVHLIDIGGGVSRLVDEVLKQKFRQITVLDISSAAIGQAKNRLGEFENKVEWIEGDVTTAVLPDKQFDIWHDRAVFHFLTESNDRLLYLAQMCKSLKPNRFAIMATFALDGPQACSGLQVSRYSASSLAYELGEAFELLESCTERHITPWGSPQEFLYCLFRKVK